MIYNELMQRGTSDFPIELYILNDKHPRYEMAAHWHNDIEIMRIINGEMIVKLDANQYTGKKGDIIFVNAQTVHSAIPREGCDYECIVMKLEMGLLEDAGCRLFMDNLLNHDIHVIEFHPCSDSNFNQSINNLFDSLHLQTHGYKFAALSALYKLLYVIMNEKIYVSASKTLPSDTKHFIALKNALAFIRENYDRPLTLSEISANTKMSPRYFCSFFKKMTQKSPIEYLVFYRIECAARKLINTNLSITEVSLSCGFNDLSYFIKTFKSHKGVSPAVFRKQFLNEITGL